MGYANHIGRVGALAVALGVGMAVANSPGVAWAGTGDDSSNASSDAKDTGPKADGGAPAKRPAGAALTPRSLVQSTLKNLTRPHPIVRGPGAAPVSGDGTITGPAALPKLTNLVPALGGIKPGKPITVFGPRPHAPQINNVQPQGLPTPSEAPQAKLAKLDATPVVPARVLTAITAPPARLSALQIDQLTPDTGAVAFSRLSAPQIMAAPAALAPAPAPNPLASLLGLPASVINAVVNLAVSVFQPVIGPGAPLDNPMLWGVLAWARRQTGQTFANHTPTLSPQQTSQDLDDRQVHGTFVPVGVLADVDGDTVTYTVPDEGEVGGPAHGVVTVDQAAHTWTYTPDAGSTADDSFTVTASDEASGFHIHAAGQTHTATALVNVDVSGPELEPNDDGTFDLNLNYGAPGEFSNVEIPEAGQPGAPQYWTVKEQHYDPETGKLVVVLEPTLAAQLLAGQHVTLNDSFTVQATPAAQQQAATFSTFSLRAAGAALAAADQGSSTPLPQPPGASFVVTEDAVDVDGHPAGAIITGKYAYVLNYESVGGVTVIDADPMSPNYNHIVTTIPTGSSPALATLAGDNVYVVNNSLFDGGQSASVTVINTTTNTVVDQFPIEPFSFTPTATPQGDRVYVTNIVSNGVYVIDSNPNSLTYNKLLDMDPNTPEIDPIHVVPTDAQPGAYQITAGTFNANGTRLYVARNYYESNQSGTNISGDVVVIDTDPTSATYNQVLDMNPATPEIDGIKVPGYVPGFGTAANGHLYQPDYDLVGAQQDPQNLPKGSVTVIDINPSSPTYHQVIDLDPSTPEIDEIPVGAYPINMATSPDGSVAYVINVADGTVTAIDTVGNRVITSFVYDTTPVDLSDPASAGPNLLAMSPNGKQLYITKYGDGTITTVSVVPTDPGVV